LRLAEVLRVLADGTRLRIVNLLLRGELCVCEIEVLLDINQSNASRHLSRLKNAGIIKGEKQAQWVHYCLDERFKADNPELYSYLQEQLGRTAQCSGDIEKLERYKNSGFTCEHISADKERVSGYLEGAE